MDFSRPKSGLAGFLSRKTSAKQNADFIIRLGEMMSKGFTIADSIDFLTMNIPALNKKQLFYVRKMLEAGTPLYEILPVLQIPSLICLQVYFAEKHGNVQHTLIYAGTQWKKTEQSKYQLVKTLQYPSSLLFLLFVLLAIVNTVVLPQFRDLHDSMGYQPEGLIFFLLFFLQWSAPAAFLLLPAAAGAAAFFLARYRALAPQNKAVMLTKLPWIGSFFKLYFTRLFARETAQLLNSGFAINEAMVIFNKQMIYPILRVTAQQVNKQLIEGEELHKAVLEVSWMDRKLASVIGHGSSNGRLGEELLFYADFCDEWLEAKVKSVTQIIQPAVFLLIGFIVLSVYLAVMLPMFEMMSNI